MRSTWTSNHEIAKAKWGARRPHWRWPVLICWQVMHESMRRRMVNWVRGDKNVEKWCGEDGPILRCEPTHCDIILSCFQALCLKWQSVKGTSFLHHLLTNWNRPTSMWPFCAPLRFHDFMVRSSCRPHWPLKHQGQQSRNAISRSHLSRTGFQPFQNCLS